MKTAIGIAFCAALFMASAIVVAQEHGEGIVLNIPDQVKWKDGPPSLPKGAQMAVLEGDPGKEGPFVFRVKVSDGYRVPPHTHPKTERVTVISGTFNIGMGKNLTRRPRSRCQRAATAIGKPAWSTFVCQRRDRGSIPRDWAVDD